jgi:hypothetical protein
VKILVFHYANYYTKARYYFRLSLDQKNIAAKAAWRLGFFLFFAETLTDTRLVCGASLDDKNAS